MHQPGTVFRAEALGVSFCSLSARTVLVIWTLAQELSSPSTLALTESAQQALGADVQVTVQELPSEGEALPLESEQGTAAVRVTWDDDEHRRAKISCFVPRLSRWVEREVRFAEDDPELERGRTLGFLVASMFIDEGGRVSVPARPSARPTRPMGRERARTAPTTAATTASTMAVSAAAAAAGPGDATGFGAWLGVDWAMGSGVWLGAALEGRAGSIPSAQATSLVLGLGAGMLWSFWVPSPSTWVGVRGAASATRVGVTHLASGERGAREQWRLIPVLELSGQAGYRLTADSALYVELGSHFFPGETEIYVAERPKAVLPYLVPLGRLGVRTSF